MKVKCRKCGTINDVSKKSSGESNEGIWHTIKYKCWYCGWIYNYEEFTPKSRHEDIGKLIVLP